VPAGISGLRLGQICLGLSEQIGQEQLWIVEKGQFVGLVFGGCLELAGCRSKGEKPPGPLLGFVWANVSRGTFCVPVTL